MKMLRWSLAAACFAACGADEGGRLRAGTDADPSADDGTAGGGAAGGASGGAGQGGASAPTGSGASESSLTVDITEPPSTMAVEVVTIRCAGECADIEAVASGGRPPYAFEWEDSSTSPKRHVCPDATTDYAVIVTDTPVATDEFMYDAQEASAKVTAEVLDCPDDPDPPVGCGAEPIQLVGKLASAPTGSWSASNGTLPGYVATSLGGLPMAIVDSRHHSLDLGDCTHLYLAGDAAGAKPLGWDDTLVVELHEPSDGSVQERWQYGVVGLVTYTPDNLALTPVLAPTVPSNLLDPPVPSPIPVAYGYEPLAIDLMTEVPVGTMQFDFTLYVLDSANVGSTTDIWLLPR